MGALSIDLLAAVLVLLVLYAAPTVVLGVLVGTVLLIPAPLVAPHLHTSYATVNHVVIAAAALRIGSMLRRRTLGAAHIRATPLHLALILLIATWGVVGVVLAPSTEAPSIAGHRLADLVFAVVFFAVTLALLRAIDKPMLTLQQLTGFLAASAVIAVVEHYTHDAYGHWLFNLAGNPGQATASQVLEIRADHVRARASGEFALAYSWAAVMLLPVVTLVALRMRRVLRIGVPLVALILLAIYWTYSRSAAAAVPAIFVLLALGVRDRRTYLAGGAAALGAVILFAADPTVRHHLSLATDQGSVGVRFQRLPPILAAVAHHRFLGLGLGGLQTIGVPTTDNFYLYAYGETGVIGAAILVAVCLIAVVQALRGLFVVDDVRRAVVAAAALGFFAFLVSGAIDDALLLGQQIEIALLLLAIATSAAEPEIGYVALPRWSLPRAVLLTATGAAVGLVAFLVAPVTVSQERIFATIDTTADSVALPTEFGNSLIATICDVSKAIRPDLSGASIDCRDNYTAPGVGTLRVESPSRKQTLQAYSALQSAANRTYYLTGFETYPLSPPISARATAWATAPASGAVFGFALALVAPLPLRRRRRSISSSLGPATRLDESQPRGGGQLG